VTVADPAVRPPGRDTERESRPPVVEAEQPASGTPPKSRTWARATVLVLFAVLVLGVVLALFTGPLETQWYENRQHHLAADFTEARQGLRPGQAVGVLQVPRLGTNVMVVEGDSAARLRGGPGHRISTVLPGRRGNAVILGHRTKWGGPFGELDRVRKGDLIAVQVREPRSGEVETFVYKARTIIEVTEGGSRRFMGRTNDYRLTLVTGRGGTFSDDRLVVSAVSGREMRNPLRSPASRATTPGPSILLNAYLLLAVVSFALAVVAHRYLRRRAGALARGFVLLPLVLAGTVFLLLDLTLLLPPVQ
jgi:LPXTG-site transpeptidase (sortase) family protein